MPKHKYLVVISGPTASGKTRLSLELAKAYRTVILSADSRQFYQEMSIGTAKPSVAELEEVPHHFINSRSISETYSVGDFARDALELLDQLYRQHEVILLVGGSGLYIQALCEGLDQFPDIPPAIRQDLQTLFEEQGLAALQAELQSSDPAYFATVDRQNPQRLLRALEVCRASGLPFSHFRQQQQAPRPFQAIYIQLQRPRAELYQRINDRVDQMMDEGLLAEARRLLPFQQLNALQTVGYKEFFPHFRGEYPLASAVELLKRNTRRYAKRQLTWNRRKGHWKNFHPDELPLLQSYLDWVMTTGHSLYWQKAAGDAQQAVLGIKGPDFWEELLTIKMGKKTIELGIAGDAERSVDPLVQTLAIHEVLRRLEPEHLLAELSPSWQQVLTAQR